MDEPSRTQQPNSTNFLKTLIIECFIILTFTASVVFILNSLHFIDVKALFTHPQQRPTATNKSVTATQDQSRKILQENQYNPLLIQIPNQPNLTLSLNNKALHYAVLITEIEGKIMSISQQSGYDNIYNASYSAKLELLEGTDNKAITLLYSKDNLAMMQVKDSNNKRIELKDLKAGDKVVIKTGTGLFQSYPNNAFELTISKK